MEPKAEENEEVFCMNDENEEEIEFVNNGGLNEEDDEFDSIVGTLQEIVLDPQFEQLQNNFFQKNCEVFEEVEENKIVYMEIFKSYQTILEDFINKELQKRIKGFEMKRFLELLGDRKDEIDEQLLEMLYSLTEFQTFKEIMLVEKKRIEHERKNLEETCKKKIPTKPLKQSSNNNTNIFSIDNKKEMFLKEENKMEINSKVLKNKIAKVNENRTDNNKKEKNECLDSKIGENIITNDISLNIISLTPQILNRKSHK